MADIQFWQRTPRLQLSVLMPRALRRGQVFNDHDHPFHELAFLLEGECRWQVGARRENLQAGDLLLVPRNTRHHEIVKSHARIGWLGFDFGESDAPLPETLLKPLAGEEWTGELTRLFEVVCAERQVEAVGSRERAELAMREILILLCRLSPAGQARTVRTPPKARRTAQLIRSAALTFAGNLAQPMRVRDLARYHSLSPSHFAVLFRKHQGASPRRFLQAARIEQARRLLAAGTLTVKEVAARCGYVDSAHLCRSFKTATGQTPKEFRRTAR